MCGYGRNGHPEMTMTSRRQTDLDGATGSGDGPDWEWMAPDLSLGGKWHTAQVANLKVAIHGLALPDEFEQWTKGLEALETPRKNYEGEGSIHNKLQLLWWVSFLINGRSSGTDAP
jgi:hypothetical protein